MGLQRLALAYETGIAMGFWDFVFALHFASPFLFLLHLKIEAVNQISVTSHLLCLSLCLVLVNGLFVFAVFLSGT